MVDGQGRIKDTLFSGLLKMEDKMEESKRVPFRERPVCSCGVKMKLVEFKGYYTSFKYWKCENCNLDEKIQNCKPDLQEKGPYVY